MLERVTVHDFAVARGVTIEPGAGLNVFTGETGAGKSLIVDALAFVFGGRRGREVIATGAERATVEAVLSLPAGRRVIERSISLAGRSTIRIDGQAATLEEAQRLAADAVDIHGQSEHLAILRPAAQLAALDAFAGLEAQREAVGRIVRELRDVRRRLRSIETDARERERLLDQLRFEVDEIGAAGLIPGEDVALRAEHQRLANAGRLLEGVATALEALDAAPLGEAVRAAQEIAERDPGAGFAMTVDALETAAADLRRQLRRYADGLEEDPGRLVEVDERLDRLARLRRKYGETVDDVIVYGERARDRREALLSSEASAAALVSEADRLTAKLGAAAAELSQARRGAAGDLVRAIAAELAGLGMGEAELSIGFACEDNASGVLVPLPDYEVVITERPPGDEGEAHLRAFTETGVDRIEFLASFNAGESPRALAAVASGGETSRFMLALTIVLASTDGPRLVVFDEVDEGVGGRTGGLVGDALARLGARHQVLCITHLPQVAARGVQHYVVTKRSDGTRTWSEVGEVSGERRVDELAAMLGGITAATRETAREMLAR